MCLLVLFKISMLNPYEEFYNFRHGVKQPRNPWSDGPEFVTQCPIKPGANFTYNIILSSEEGTLWWHSHSDWTRATVHGAIVIYPKNGTHYPFSKPDVEVPIMLGMNCPLLATYFIFLFPRKR